MMCSTMWELSPVRGRHDAPADGDQLRIAFRCRPGVTAHLSLRSGARMRPMPSLSDTEWKPHQEKHQVSGHAILVAPLGV
jgi:hypothetical protein